jgi:spore coat polysaccharide biosynthesis protein SpsF
MKLYNSQESFWKGSFGDKYIERNSLKKILHRYITFYKKNFSKSIRFNSVIELGANIGTNLVALNKIYKNLEITAVEINQKASQQLSKIKNVKVINNSILKFKLQKKFDLVIIAGVLIHIDPKDLKNVYKKIAQLSKKYIYMSTYYNPYLVPVNYRGHKNKLYQNDYAGEFLTIYKNYKLVDYGFNYHLDKKSMQDDSTWFLFKKI